MSLTNPEKVVTEERLSEFYQGILPYLGGMNENDYSTTEKIVGTWIDGKPIYQKTFIDTMPTVITNGKWYGKSVSTGLNNVNLINIHGFTINANGGVKVFPCFRREQNDTLDSGIDVMLSGSYEIGISCCALNFSDRPCYITLQYTKTT